METVKLYYENAFLQDFTAVVESCGAVKGGFAVVLDRTAFYPEGGGQPADHGTLGDARVLDVHEKDGVVTHLCDHELPVGAEVSGHIDWARRFDHMQQHSGEHIVSGMLCSAFHCDNVGFHLGADTVTIDYNADISWEQVQDIERRANRYIWENHPIHIWYPSPEELAALPYRSKKALEGPVRLTEFSGADLCACCGTHVAASGQVGLVKFVGWQKFRDGVRLELLCGQRALDHLSACWEQSRQIGQSLSVKPEASFGADAVRAAGRQGTRRRIGSAGLRPHSGGIRRRGRHRAHHRAAGGRRCPPPVRRRGPDVRRPLRRVLRNRRHVPVRAHPCRTGYPAAGEGHERDAAWPGRRPRRLCPGQRRLHGGGDPGLFLPVNRFAARNSFASFQQKAPPKCAEKAHFGDFLLWIYMIQ